VQINPIHASYFTPQDMALRLYGKISESTIYTEPIAPNQSLNTAKMAVMDISSSSSNSNI